MNFRQIIAKFSPVDSKNKLNDLLAEVERSYGVFSRDMELDIRATISVPAIAEYFDRIIHEEHPKLEHDAVAKEKPKSTNNKSERKIPKVKDIKPITYGNDQIGLKRNRQRLPHDEYILRKLVKNGRDYSKPTLESQLNKSRNADGKDKPRQWVKIISVPMGGMNKKY